MAIYAKPKFKVGQKVRTDGGFGHDPAIGTIVSISGSGDLYQVKVPKSCHPSIKLWNYFTKELELARGRPPKPKPIKFIATYDEVDKDPYKTFTSKKELNEWLEEAKKDEEIEFGSIKVYEIKKEFGVETSFKLVERG